MYMYSIITNPTSGKGKAAEKLEMLKQLLTGRGIDFRVDKTDKPGDAQQKAACAVAEGLNGIIVVGGDGTFSDVLNGVGESGIEVIFGPNGTGNDFVRMFDLPKDTIAAIEKQLNSPVNYIDIGKCNDRYFLNVTGCGFDVEVLRVADQFKEKASAIGAYLRGAYSAIKNYKPMDVVVSIDDGPEKTIPTTVLSVGNGSYIGGGMKAVPGACVNDGMLDVMIAGKVNRISIYGLLLLFVAGKHPLIKKVVSTARCKKIRIKGKDLYLEADGEIFRSDEVELSVLPGALKTRLPL